MLREITTTLNGALFLQRAELAESFFDRSRGLLGRDELRLVRLDAPSPAKGLKK